MRRMRGVFLALLACAIVPAVIGAQSTKPCMIAGMIRDTSGAALPGVSVEVVSDVTRDQSRVMSTDADGKFQFTDLPSGTYTLTASRPEFQTFKREGMYLAPGMNTSMVVTLRPDPIRD